MTPNLLKVLLTLTILCTLVPNVRANKQPLFTELTQITLPFEDPRGIASIAYDGEKLWFPVHLPEGRFGSFDPKTNELNFRGEETLKKKIPKTSQLLNQIGGITFIDGKLWIGRSGGDSIGSIDNRTWEADTYFSVRNRPDFQNSQSFAALAFDGKDLWAAWHMTEYKLPASESQQLLKINASTGKILERYALPEGKRPDTAHGLAFDGESLWHMKDQNLVAISLRGQVLESYRVKEIVRPSGLAWDGEVLWIVEASGKLWRLPLK